MSQESSTNKSTTKTEKQVKSKSESSVKVEKVFKYDPAEYPHVVTEAMNLANNHPDRYTPDGAQRFVDQRDGVDPGIIAAREQANPRPESEVNRPKSTGHSHQQAEHAYTVREPNREDKVGRAEQREKADIGVANHRDGVDEGGKKKKEFYNVYELWEFGVQHFQHALPNLHVVFTGQGHRGGFEFGLEEKFPSIKGINAPAGACIIRTLKKFSQTIYTTFSSIPNEQARDFWMPLISGYAKGSAISRAVQDIEDVKTTKSVSIDGKTAFKMIPPLQWFNEGIREIDPIEGLLAIFPEAEAKTFLLHLGRMAFGIHSGCDRIPYIEGFPIAPVYRYRTAIIMNGVPRIGKSTLMEEIIQSVGQVGYSHSVMSSDPNRFSFNGVPNDILLLDDMTEQPLKNILSSSQLKSVISGNKIETEKKGIDGTPTLPNCSIFFSCNTVVFPKDVDPGIIDRSHFLTTHTYNQMLAKNVDSGINLFTGNYWDDMSRELQVEKSALALYLVRCGLEMFLKEIGVSQDEYGDWVQDPLQDSLMSTLNENRKHYKFKTPVNPRSSVSNICRKSHVLASIFLQQEIPSCYNDYGFNAFTLLQTSQTVLHLETILYKLKEKTKEIGNSSDILTPIKIEMFSRIKEWLMPQEEIVITEMIWQQYVSVFASNFGRATNDDHNTPFPIGQTKNTQFEEMFKTMVKCMTDRDGNLIDQDRPAWAQEFARAKDDEPMYRIELMNILEDYDGRIDFEQDKEVGRLPEEFLLFRAK